MFDKINSILQLKSAKLYISVEFRTKVGGEDVQQTTLKGGGGEELQSVCADNHPTLTCCTTIFGNYTLPCHKTPTPMMVCGSNYQYEYIPFLRGIRQSWCWSW